MGIIAHRHVGITVSDLARAERFYCDYLGMKRLSFLPEREGKYIETLVGVPGAKIDIMMLEAVGGMRLELLQYKSHPAPPNKPAVAIEPGRPHVAFAVDDLMGLYNRRDEFGCVFKSPPLLSPDNVLVAYAHDPDGTILELVELLAGHGA